MSEEIIKVIDELGKRFGIVLDWSNQNIIPYLQELMKRFIVYRNGVAVVQIVVSIIVIILSILAIKKLLKWKKSENFMKHSYDEDDFVFNFCIITTFIVLFLAIGFIIGNSIGIIKNICMPELVIYEYIKNLQA